MDFLLCENVFVSFYSFVLQVAAEQFKAVLHDTQIHYYSIKQITHTTT